MCMYTYIFMCVKCMYLCVCTYLFPHIAHVSGIHKHLSKINKWKGKKRKFSIGWFLTQFRLDFSFQFFQRGKWCLVECGVHHSPLCPPWFFSLPPVPLLGRCSKSLTKARRGCAHPGTCNPTTEAQIDPQTFPNTGWISQSLREVHFYIALFLWWNHSKRRVELHA